MKIEPFSKTYEGRRVLEFPGIELQSGRVYCVIGANGCGKSTLAKVLAGVVRPDTGMSPVWEEKGVGYMPQKNFSFRMSARANVRLGGKDYARAERLMKALQIEHLADQRAHKLSGGETARMALARVLMGTHRLLILDEPTASMDVEMTLLSEELLQNYVRQSGCVLLLVTHSLQQARRIADEVLFLHKGSLLESGDRDQVLLSPRREETRRFLEFYGT